ncbi:prolyl oligopeptidase family serine peptidase [Bacillus thuringiensis]|uniref:S9 family peptidase n=1 Tax=Bacillus thuringiensis TaxID=1428 RepID=UPI00222515C8|nr:prolyl oligopeptidase family serine peptidase [Bacillus thuringiensis]UYX52133.1 prolyl oligopeptidase family serine peptidase [Bacillus thuringiensis]
MIQFPKADAEQFFRSYRISKFTVSGDEKRLIFSTNLNGHANLWAMDLPNLSPYPLTYCNQSSNFIKVDPLNRFILAGFDNDGDENYHIYALKPEGGELLELIPAGEKEKDYYVHLTEDGERLYYVTSKDNPRFFNSRCYNLRTKEDILLCTGVEAPTYLSAVSPNESSFIVLKSYGNTYNVGYVKKGGELICMVPSSEKEHIITSICYIDENTVIFVTNYEEEFSYVASFDLDKQEFKPICKIENEEVSTIKWHAEKKTSYIVTSKGVEDRLYKFVWDTKELILLDTPVDTIKQIDISKSKKLYLLGESATKTANIYCKENESTEWEMLTKNYVIGLPESSFVEPDIVTYSSFDGLKIEALLFRANEEVQNGYTIFWPHGGPQWAEVKDFTALFQYLLRQGYNIFAPNFRGSTRYGSTFTKMIEGDWGEAPRLDCVAGIEWLFEQGISTADKLFVMGGSYGGYMTLLLYGRHSECFRAAIDLFGPSSLFSFIDSMPEEWKPIAVSFIGDVEKDKDKLMKGSPITYLNQMKKPLLIVQGANDPRVVKTESDQIFRALQEKEVDVEYIVLEDEGHGFSKKENEIYVYRRITEFLAKHK